MLPKIADYLEGPDSEAACLSVWHLLAFFNGIEIAMEPCGCAPEKYLAERGAFREWLQRKHGHEEKDENEFQISYRLAANNRQAVDIFLGALRSSLKEHGSERVSPISKTVAASVDLYSGLEQVRARPYFYVPCCTISHLKALVDGMMFVGSTALENGRLVPDFSQFTEWLASKRHSVQAYPRWDMILTAMCGGDECRAYDLFFEELGNYRKGAN